MNVLWTHNFNPNSLSSGVFVQTAFKGLKEAGINVDMEYLGNLRSISNVINAKQYLKKISDNYDIVHAQYGSACSVLTSTITNKPTILSLRGNDWNVHQKTPGFSYLHTRLARMMTMISINKFDCIITVSNKMRNEVLNKYPDLVIYTLPSPIDLTIFKPIDKMRARSILGYPNCKKKWILFNSLRLNDPVKRFNLAKKAFEIANEKHGDLVFKIANNLHHHKIPILLSASDLILCTSENEGWPNSVKEALACNLPFVSTDVSDLNIIAKQEKSCRICPADEEIIAENICQVLALTEKANLRRYVEHMSLEKSTENLINIYEKILA